MMTGPVAARPRSSCSTASTAAFGRPAEYGAPPAALNASLPPAFSPLASHPTRGGTVKLLLALGIGMLSITGCASETSGAAADRPTPTNTTTTASTTTNAPTTTARTATAEPSGTPDDVFMQQMDTYAPGWREDFMLVDDVPPELAAQIAATAMCSSLETISVEDVLLSYLQGELPDETVGTLLYSATVAYCPEYTDDVQEYADANR